MKRQNKKCIIRLAVGMQNPKLHKSKKTKQNKTKQNKKQNKTKQNKTKKKKPEIPSHENIKDFLFEMFLFVEI